MRVDTHLHAYADAAEGLHDLTAYPIVEYGEKDDVVFAGVAGTVDDALRALADADVDYAALLGSYELPALPHPEGGARHWPVPPAHPDHVDGLVAYNRWLCDVGAAHPQLLPFVTANPAVMTSAQSGAHLAEAFGDWGGRGLKLHPIAIRTYPDDPGLIGVYEACADARAPIVFHSGPDLRGYGWSDPAAFAAVAAAHPRLMMILAHLGGASWRAVTALAEAQRGIFFDLSEIVMWIGATKGPTAEQVVGLIREIGVERITMGSDFPWYSPGATADVVEGLPGLGRGERDAILGDNAARILRLV
ncbi:amidohydrolase family protein [Microbacterium rhizomatis]|uniref:Amidohydrolase family protein n=1 Tax=Microbacterium rhizomatis TaxID=1631477 RepID=A0A5J5J1Z3_9MICO|nr:amidohydrolase family protein [Microbacterium rhizomatis]KAA9108024.1 amidohydrolase family protein [Microbacterium rhizomatis]